MNFHQSIFQNNNLKIIKYLSLIVLIFALSFKANTEIPEKYKIESSLPKCKGTDYKIWTDCYDEYKFPRIEYKGEWTVVGYEPHEQSFPKSPQEETAFSGPKKEHWI